jgi:hypothetical protein
MLFITWCCNLEKMLNLWVLGSTSELVNLTILAKKSLSIEFPEAKSQSEKKNVP